MDVGGEDGADLVGEQLHERLPDVGHVVDGHGRGRRAETERRIVAVAARVLNEEQGRRDGRTGMAVLDQTRIEQGLQIVVAMAGEALLKEDGLHIGQGLQPLIARLVVDDADAGQPVLAHHVEAVDAATDGERESLPTATDLYLPRDVGLKTDDGEGCQLAVELQELAQVVDDHFAIDDLQAIQVG